MPITSATTSTRGANRSLTLKIVNTTDRKLVLQHFNPDGTVVQDAPEVIPAKESRPLGVRNIAAGSGTGYVVVYEIEGVDGSKHDLRLEGKAPWVGHNGYLEYLSTAAADQRLRLTPTGGDGDNAERVVTLSEWT
jgi:hypothetical protein